MKPDTFNDLGKNFLKGHPGENRGPGLFEITEFRLLPETNSMKFSFLRDRRFWLSAGDPIIFGCSVL
jgi:hypothetical protein